MCGRAYQTYTDEEMLARYFNKRPPRIPSFTSNYNLSPTQTSPIVRVSKEGELVVELMNWGLIPYWAKDAKIGYSTINARGETVAQKPAFREAFKKRRCIVPVSGFYEWKRPGEAEKKSVPKRPFAIHARGGAILSLAGLWEEWKPAPDVEPVRTFTIVTTDANRFMTEVHDRMPVILSPEGEKEWLDPATPAERLQALIRPAAEDALEKHEVSTLVNSPKNNAPDVLKPV